MAIVILAACTDPAGGGSSGGGSTVSSGADGSGGVDATGTGGSGGSGGSGGAGAGGGAEVCAPETTARCYAGPAGTEGVGVCRAGVATCNAGGTAFGPCEGEVLPSADDCATPEDEDCDGSPASCDGALLWSRTFGALDLPQRITSIGRANAGRVVAGHFQGDIKVSDDRDEPAYFGLERSQGGYDIFLGMGTETQRYGGAGDQLCNSVAVDALRNIFMTGSFDGALDFGGGPLANAGGKDVFLVKLNGGGEHIWSKRFGGAGDQEGISATLDDLGNVFVVGDFEGTVDFGGGPLVSGGGKDIFAAKWSAAGGLLWSRSFGGPGDQRAARSPRNVGGNLVFTGSFEQTIDFGGGPLASAGGKDVFVAKLSDAGEHVFSRRYGGPSDQEGLGVATAGFAGHVLLTGWFEGSIDLGSEPLASAGGKDAFVARLDGAGNLQWGRGFGDADDQSGVAVLLEAGGNALVTGSFRGTVSFGGAPLVSAGGLDTFVARFDASGAHLWSGRFGAEDDDAVADIAIDAPPHSWAYIAGSRCSGAEPGCGAPLGPGHDAFFQAFYVRDGAVDELSVFGDHLPSQGLSRVAADPSGNVLATGALRGLADLGEGIVSARGDDYASFVAKYDGAGNLLWHRIYNVSVIGGTLATDASENVLFTNHYQTGDSVLIKLDASGNHVWGTVFNGVARYALAVDPAGNSAIAGLTGYSYPDTMDIVVMKFDAAGNAAWRRRFANGRTQQSVHVALDPVGNVILMGTFSGPLDFGGGSLPGSSSGDMYLVKLDPAGGHVSSRLVRGAKCNLAGLDGAGGMVMLCKLDGTADFGDGPLPAGNALVKLDAAGNLLWSKPTSGNHSASTMYIGAGGEIFMSGSCFDRMILGDATIRCDQDLYVAKLDAAGNYLWSNTFGSQEQPWRVSCTGDPDGNLIAGGTFAGRLDLGSGPVGSVGRAEGFLAKFAR